MIGKNRKIKVKRGKKDFWMPAASLGVVGADPKVRTVHVSPLWSTTAVSTAAVEHLSYGAHQLWSTSAGSTMAMEHRSLEYPAEEHYRLEHHHRGEPQPAAPVQETQLSVLMDFANQLFNKSMI